MYHMVPRKPITVRLILFNRVITLTKLKSGDVGHGISEIENVQQRNQIEKLISEVQNNGEQCVGTGFGSILIDRKDLNYQNEKLIQ